MLRQRIRKFADTSAHTYSISQRIKKKFHSGYGIRKLLDTRRRKPYGKKNADTKISGYVWMVPEIKSTQTHSLAIHIYNFKQGEMLSAWIRKEMVAVFCVSRSMELKKGEVPENQTSRVNTIFFFFSILSYVSLLFYSRTVNIPICLPYIVRRTLYTF